MKKLLILSLAILSGNIFAPIAVIMDGERHILIHKYVMPTLNIVQEIDLQSGVHTVITVETTYEESSKTVIRYTLQSDGIYMKKTICNGQVISSENVPFQNIFVELRPFYDQLPISPQDAQERVESELLFRLTRGDITGGTRKNGLYMKNEWQNI